MPRKYLLLSAAFALAKILLHFSANQHYGFHADELYYLALAQHPQWCYPDVPPFIVGVARTSSFLFGDSLFAYRILPTLVAALSVFLTGVLTTHLGGKRFAVAAACSAMLFSPVFLATSYFLQPIVFEHLFWLGCAMLMIRYVQTGAVKYIYFFALVFTVAFYNKYIILLYVLALFAGLAGSGYRIRRDHIRHLLRAFFLCILLFSPLIFWQAQHGFPVFGYLKTAAAHRSRTGTGDFLFQFVFFNGSPMAVWMAGLGLLFFHRDFAKYRFAAWAFLGVLAVLVVAQGKPYYGLGVFPVLFAAGGRCWELLFQKAAPAFRYAFFTMLFLPTLIALPLVVPILPFSYTKQFFSLMMKHTAIRMPLVWDDGRVHRISQFYADMFGWEELVRKTSAAYRQLPETQKKNVKILADSYAISGALQQYGKIYPLPVMIAPANSFALFSPEKLHDAPLIFYTRLPADSVHRLAAGIRFLGRITDPDAHETGTGIYLLIHPSRTLKVRYTDERNRFLNRTR